MRPISLARPLPDNTMQARTREDENKKTVFENLPQKLLTWILPLSIITSYVFLAAQQDLRKAIPILVGITALIILTLAFISYIEERTRTVLWSPTVIIAVAILIRLLFLLRPPELSDDIYRYLWDGLQTLNAHNPYAAAPSGIPGHAKLYNRLFAHINHPDLITIYPPAAQLSFATGAYFGGTILGIKALLFAIDISTCLLLLRLLSYLNLPSWRSVLYAWHPLPVIEITSSGHIDGVGIFFFLLVIFLLLKGSPANTSHSEQGGTLSSFKKASPALLAGISFAFASLIKLFPLIFLPAFLMLVKKRFRIVFAAGFMFGSASLILPFLPGITNMFGTLNLYLQSWEFSGFLFRLLRELTSSGSIARLMLSSFFLPVTFFLYRNLWNKRYRVYRDENADDFMYTIKTFYLITMTFLLLTTTFYPWYVLTLVALFPFAGGSAGIVLSWAVFLSYSVLIAYTYSGQWMEDDTTAALIFLAPVLTFLLVATARKLMREKLCS